MSTIKANTIQPINAATGLVLRTNEVDRLNINTSGDVGIGVSPSYKLHVSGTCAIVPNTNVGMRIYEDTDSANFLRFRPLSSTGSQTGFMFSGDDDSPHLTINYTSLVSGSPRIGIGTASPAVALDVTGEARSSTSTTSSSNANTLTTKDYVDSQLRVGSVVVITASSRTDWPKIGGSFNNGGVATGQTTASLTGVPSSWTVTIVGTDLKVVTNGGTWRGTFIHDNSAAQVAIRYAYQTGTTETVYPTNHGFTLILVRIA